MLGTYGLFEALDLRPESTTHGEPFAVVRSHMAHHQGMILVALDNLLNDQIMVERFHADRQIETAEFLLNERSPAVAPREWPIVEPGNPATVAPAGESTGASAPWSPDSAATRQAFVLSNGRLSSLLTSSGGGGLRWRGLAITRYDQGAAGRGDGLWIYVRDDDSGSVWPASSEQGRTTFEVHQAEFHQRHDGVSVRLEVSVAPAGDVEVRKVTLHNETDRPRHLRVSSAAEPVLLPLRAAARPPRVRSAVPRERVGRRPRRHRVHPAPPVGHRRAGVLVHRIVGDAPSVRPGGNETDRSAFFGRGASADVPLSLCRRGPRASGHVGAVLDPVLSVTACVDLKPQESVTFAFVTTVGRTRSAALDLARRYGSMHAVRWALTDAAPEGRRRLARAQLDPPLLPAVAQLFSALLFADPTLRAPPAVLAAGRPSRKRLWARSISGDEPIVLVRVRDPRLPLAPGDCRPELPARLRHARGPRAAGRETVRLPRRRSEGFATCSCAPRRTRGSASPGASSCSRPITSPQASETIWKPLRGSCWIRRRWAPRSHDAAPLESGEAAPLRAHADRRHRAREGAGRDAAVRQRLGGVLRGRTRIRDHREAGEADAGPLVQRAVEPRLWMPRQRVLARLHVVAQRGREPFDPVAQRSGLRHSIGGAVPARRGDGRALVAYTATGRRRRGDARPPRGGLHDLHAGDPWPRARADDLRAPRRAREGRAAQAPEQARAPQAPHGDLLRRMGARQPA